MTPDVSSVEAVAEREGGCERWPSSCRCSACCFSYEALQQAAEQACYRYALELCERLQAKEQDGVSLADGYRAMAIEVSVEMQWLKKQLIKGSA